MHLRGKRFEYDIVHDDGGVEPLLRVNYHFHWQLSYSLAQPRPLKAGTRLRAIAWYDNSKNNPHNPDPEKTVSWGDQTSDEMMVGFFDVAVPAAMDKWHYSSEKRRRMRSRLPQALRLVAPGISGKTPGATNQPLSQIPSQSHPLYLPPVQAPPILPA